jgi:hypothetical protein
LSVIPSRCCHSHRLGRLIRARRAVQNAFSSGVSRYVLIFLTENTTSSLSVCVYMSPTAYSTFSSALEDSLYERQSFFTLVTHNTAAFSSTFKALDAAQFSPPLITHPHSTIQIVVINVWGCLPHCEQSALSILLWTSGPSCGDHRVAVFFT